jgi:hypothetical protein
MMAWMRRKLLTTALEAVGVASDVARHMLWYASYHMHGTTQESELPVARRRPAG